MPVYVFVLNHNKVERLNGYVLVQHFQISKPEQLATSVLQQYVHSNVFRLPPEVLNRASHTGKVCLPVPFPNPHHCASTCFVCLQDVYLLLVGPETNVRPQPDIRNPTGT
jgi:hypothetical protein